MNSILKARIGSLKARIGRREALVVGLASIQTKAVAAEGVVLEVREVVGAERAVAVLLLLNQKGRQVKATEKAKPETKNYRS